MSSSESALQELRQRAVSAVVALGTIAFIIWGYGQFIGDPVELNILAPGFMILMAAFIGLSWYTNKSTDFIIGFSVIGVVLLLVAFRLFAPRFILDVLSSVIDPGFELIGLSGVTFTGLINTSGGLLVLVLVAVIPGIALAKRLTADGKSLDVVLDRTFAQLAEYWETYLDIGRLFVFFLVSLAAVVLFQLAELSGQIGELIAMAPFVFTNLVTAVVGFFALGGSLLGIDRVPILSDLGPAGWVLIVVVAVLLAAAVSQGRGSGSLSQFVRRLQ